MKLVLDFLREIRGSEWKSLLSLHLKTDSCRLIQDALEMALVEGERRTLPGDSCLQTSPFDRPWHPQVLAQVLRSPPWTFLVSLKLFILYCLPYQEQVILVILCVHTVFFQSICVFLKVRIHVCV